MSYIMVANLIHKRVLTARESVKAVVPELVDQLARGGGSIEFDFIDIEGVTPSVLDQLLISVEHLAGPRDIRLLNMPDPMTRKHEALARAHRRLLSLDEDGAWVLAPQ